jgi:hypothetical protein
MATSSEELASQADHLKETISFFRIDQQQRSFVQKSKTNLQPSPQGTHAPKVVTTKGVALNLSPMSGADELDNSFEKY